MTMVHGSKQLGARLHQWHAGMDAIYAVGSQFYAGRPAPLRDVKEALRLLEQEHRNRKATKLRADAVTHLNAVVADLHDAMWSAIGEHGDPDAGTGYPRENPRQRRKSPEERRGWHCVAGRCTPDSLLTRAAAQAGTRQGQATVPVGVVVTIVPPPPLGYAKWKVYATYGDTHSGDGSSHPSEKSAIKAAFRLAKEACRDPNASSVWISHAGRNYYLDSDCELSTADALSLLTSPAARAASRAGRSAATAATGHARAAASHVAGNVSRGAGIIWRKLRGARANPAPIVRQRVTELLPDVVIHYTAHGVWLRGMPRSYRGDRMWAASGVDEAREMAAYLARGLRATGAVRSIEIAKGSPEKARRSR